MYVCICEHLKFVQPRLIKTNYIKYARIKSCLGWAERPLRNTIELVCTYALKNTTIFGQPTASPNRPPAQKSYPVYLIGRFESACCSVIQT